jgi:hypothetical protein
MSTSILARLLWVAIFLSSSSAFAGVPTQTRPWRDYRTIMWVGDSVYRQPEKMSLFLQRLREMGINTSMIYGEGDPAPLVRNRFPYYVENIINRGLCLKFNSNVRDWDKFVTGWAGGHRPDSALIRDYCLDDPGWRDWGRRQMQAVASKNREQEPLAYDIHDELSTTFSANPFDYDFSPLALQGFRAWLRTRYASLAALNEEWETRFAGWDVVRPFTTDQIKNRMASGEATPAGSPDWQQLQNLHFTSLFERTQLTRWNFSPWADFRTYMDLSLARALADFRQAAHDIDPRTPVGIEGTQMPNSFGGYDLWRLSQVLDWAEPYDVGNAREILGSFMRDKPLITTVFEQDAEHASRRLWHLLLEGDRGCIVWWSEDCIDWQSADWPLTSKGRALAPVLKEMTSSLARLFLRAKRETDPIFIHYSQPSIQVDWLLESVVDGSTWLRRFSSFEAEHNRQVKVRNGWLRAFQDLGYSPVFVSSEQIASGALAGVSGSNSALVLPSSWALADREVEEIRSFLNPGGHEDRLHAVFWDGCPALYDEHGRLRENVPPPFNVSTGSNQTACVALVRDLPAQWRAADISRYAIERIASGGSSSLRPWIVDQLKPYAPEISLTPTACVRVHRFRVPRGGLVAFERNIDYQMSEELKQLAGNEALERPIRLDAHLATPMHVYDLREQKYLGLVSHIEFTLQPWRPSLFALATEKIPEGDLLKLLTPE